MKTLSGDKPLTIRKFSCKFHTQFLSANSRCDRHHMLASRLLQSPSVACSWTLTLYNWRVSHRFKYTGLHSGSSATVAVQQLFSSAVDTFFLMTYVSLTCYQTQWVFLYCALCLSLSATVDLAYILHFELGREGMSVGILAHKNTV